MGRRPAKQKRRKRQVNFSGSSGRSAQKRGRVSRVLVRWSAWIFLVAALCAVLVATVYGLRQLFFVRNDHFMLTDVDVQLYGDLKPEVVQEKIAELGIRRQGINLFSIDLQQLRQDLEAWHVQISRVRVHRRLPGTLAVDVYERNPVAQLLVPRGYLLDGEGLVLPKRNDPRAWYLPVITGVRKADELSVGARIDDKLVMSSLKLLELIGTQEYGKYLDVNLIQLDHGSEELKVYLRERQPFREGACVILPAPEDEMKGALARVHRIVRDRLRGHQATGFINATFERNVPVTHGNALQSLN